MSAKRRMATGRRGPKANEAGQPSSASGGSHPSTHLIGAHFNEDVYRAFRRLAAEQLKTHDAILTEALVLYFALRGPGVPSALRLKAQKLGLRIDQ
jgi:hypothetical protein